MKRPSQWFPPEIAFGFFIGILFCLALAGPLSYQASHCQPEQQRSTPGTENQQAPTLHEQSGGRDSEVKKHAKNLPIGCGFIGFVPAVVGFMDKHEGFFVGIFTFFLFAATMALWRSTNKLWDAGERQLEHVVSEAERQTVQTSRSIAVAEKSAQAAKMAADFAEWSHDQQGQIAERQLRAYVLPVMAQIQKKGSRNDSPEARVVIKNTGQTPAYKLEQWTEILAGPYPRTEPFEEWKDRPGHFSILGPGEVSTAFISMSEPLSERWDRAIQEGEAAIWVHGGIEYFDAFGKPRRTKFRFIFGGVVGIRPDGGMAAAPEGNEAD